MAKRSSDGYDLEHTDELPILLEAVVFPENAGANIDDTAGNPALYHGLAEEAVRTAAPQGSEEIAALEAQLHGVADLNRELDRQLAERDRTIDDLNRTLTALRDTTEDAAGAQRQLATQLTLRDARLAELSVTIERLQEDLAARTAEIESLREAAQLSRLDAEVAVKEASAPSTLSVLEGEIESLREQNALLSSYIDGRRRWWNDLQTAHKDLRTRAAALVQELAANDERRSAAADFAARESRRATTLRDELVTYARRVEELERELKQARTADSAATDARGRLSAPDAVSPPRADLVEAEPAPSAPTVSQTVHEPTPSAGEAIPAREAIAQLEAEVAYKRQQVAAQLVELHEREQQLRETTTEIARLREGRKTLYTELGESRATTARLEQTVIDKDRALAARDRRIGTLQEELERRAPVGAPRNLEALGVQKPGLSFGEHALDLAKGAAPPALLCLTGDAPPRTLLTQESLIVGRGKHCDLQILAGFVSRKHARITTTGVRAFIEDLGSRNGVYVNSVRVDRQELRQGDLILIGQTQFRFLESMAH